MKYVYAAFWKTEIKMLQTNTLMTVLQIGTQQWHNHVAQYLCMTPAVGSLKYLEWIASLPFLGGYIPKVEEL